MTTEERQKLSELTDQAVQNDDLDSLKQILQILEDDFESQPVKLPNFFEWFENSLTPDQSAALFE